MHTQHKMLLGAAGLALFVLAAGCGKETAATPEPTDKSAAPVTTAAVASPSPQVATEVRDVAANPAAHVGPLTLSGVVAVVTPKKGFVLLDTKEYQGEGFACLTTDEPIKVSVRWPGDAPKIKDAVQVAGQLVKEGKGFAFTAEKVAKQ